MTLCRWYCSVAFWAGKPHNNYVNVKICKMPIMRCTHSFPSSIRIGKNTKGFKNLNDLFWQGAAHALGVWTVPSPTQIGSKQPWATGKVVTFVVEMLQKYFWQSKVNNILSLVHCLLQNTFATHSTFQLCKVFRLHQGDKSFTPAFTIRNRKVFRSFVWPWFWSSCWCVVQCVPYLARPPGSDQ